MSESTSKRGTVGLLTAFTPEIFKSEYHNRIISGIIGALRQTPYDLKLIMVKDEEYADPSRKIIKEHQIDGLLLLTWRIHPKYVEEAMSETDRDLPTVIINDYTPGLKSNIVYCDNSLGMRLAMNHLISRGYKKIGMLQGPDEASLDARERYHIYKSLMEEYGLSLNPSHYRKCDYFFEEDGYLKMMDMIQNAKPLPRAVVCFNDDIALGALRALKECWIKCPEEVAIIGYDGIEKGKYVEPALTTVKQPLEVMGREMVNILIGIIEGKLTPPIQQLLAPELVMRQST